MVFDYMNLVWIAQYELKQKIYQKYTFYYIDFLPYKSLIWLKCSYMDVWETTGNAKISNDLWPDSIFQAFVVNKPEWWITFIKVNPIHFLLIFLKFS